MEKIFEELGGAITAVIYGGAMIGIFYAVYSFITMC